MNILANPERKAAAERLEGALSNRERHVISEYVNKISTPLPSAIVSDFENKCAQQKKELEEAFPNGFNLDTLSHYKVRQAEKRIKESEERITLVQLKNAIAIGDQPAIAKCLRKLQDDLPLELVRKLANYLDPGRPPMKSGPKKSNKPHSPSTIRIISLYRFLCDNREAAKWLFNAEQEAFIINEQSSLLDNEGNFSPEWKYPLSKRNRNLINAPNRELIKNYVCERFAIKSRRFDDIYSANNKDIIEFYNRLCADIRFSGDEPKRFTCQMYDIKPVALDKMLA